MPFLCQDFGSPQKDTREFDTLYTVYTVHIRNCVVLIISNLKPNWLHRWWLEVEHTGIQTAWNINNNSTWVCRKFSSKKRSEHSHCKYRILTWLFECFSVKHKLYFLGCQRQSLFLKRLMFKSKRLTGPCIIGVLRAGVSSSPQIYSSEVSTSLE